MTKYKILKNGKETAYGKGLSDGWCWGMFTAAIIHVLVVAL